MTVLETLSDLGFSAAIVGDRKGVSVVRVRTARGWTYEKFKDDDEPAVRAWAANHTPE